MTCRYHSLVVDESSLPDCLQPIAWSHGMHHAVATASSTQHASTLRGPTGSEAAAAGVDGGAPVTEQAPLVMALAHTARPHYGVQFHPESICTKYGAQLVLNFLQLACNHLGVESTTMPRWGAWVEHVHAVANLAAVNASSNCLHGHSVPQPGSIWHVRVACAAGM